MGILKFLKKNKTNNEVSNETVNKENFNVGDVFYGNSDVRPKPIKYLANYGKRSKIKVINNPKTIDSLNIASGITNFIQYGEPLTYVGSPDNYFITDNKLAVASLDPFRNYSKLYNSFKISNFNKESDNLSVRWLAFLKDNLEYLNFDKDIESLNVFQPNNLKDRLFKNSTDRDLKYQVFSDELRKQLICSYNKNAFVKMDAYSRQLCTYWMQTNFFRKTSKLGIDFFIKEKKNIHFVLDVPEHEKNRFFKGKNSMDKFADLKNSNREYQPITTSELRYINRKHGFDHPQIDFFKFSKNTYEPIRKNEMGYLKEYLKRREAAGNKSYDKFLEQSATKLETKKNGVKPKIEDKPIRKKKSKGIR